MTLFTCSACREAMLPKSVGGGNEASDELLGGRGTRAQKIKSGRWLARSQIGYDDGWHRIPSS
jgi:hypothetical protein